MPRLIGKKHNPLPALTVAFIFGCLLGVGLTVSEYKGIIDYVPKFGVEKSDLPVRSEIAN